MVAAEQAALKKKDHSSVSQEAVARSLKAQFGDEIEWT